MGNHEQYTIHILQFVHIYALYSYQSSENTAQKGFNCFDLTFGHVHILPIFFTSGLLIEAKDQKVKNYGLS